MLSSNSSAPEILREIECCMPPGVHQKVLLDSSVVESLLLLLRTVEEEHREEIDELEKEVDSLQEEINRLKMILDENEINY